MSVETNRVTAWHSGDSGITWYAIYPDSAPEPEPGWLYRLSWSDQRGGGVLDLPAGLAIVANEDPIPARPTPNAFVLGLLDDLDQRMTERAARHQAYDTDATDYRNQAAGVRQARQMVRELRESVQLGVAGPAPDTEAPSEDDLIPVERATGVTREQLLPPATEVLVAYRERTAERNQARADLAARDIALAEASAEVERLRDGIAATYGELAASRAEVERLTGDKAKFREENTRLRTARDRVLALCDEAEKTGTDIPPLFVRQQIATAEGGSE